MSKIFRFKQFTVEQEGVAAKIGTDAVLLGAWCPVLPSFQHCLDIGTGTGVIALMLAQRGAKIVDAIELDSEAYKTAKFNVEQSPWAERLNVYKGDFLDFSLHKKYDLVVSNPPFYQDSFPIDNYGRARARSEAFLPFTQLIEKVASLLSPNGIFAVIIPYEYETQFLEKSAKNGIFPQEILRVRGNAQSKIKRSCLALTSNPKNLTQKEIFIEKARHVYNQDYISIVKDFYLKM